jgi:fructose-specific phosphotransferase system IIC component
MKILQRIKDNKEYLLGVVLGVMIVASSLWLWDKLIASSFNGGINISTVFDLNNGFIVLALLALVGIACCLWFVVKFVFWIIEWVINHRTYHQSSDNSKPQ